MDVSAPADRDPKKLSGELTASEKARRPDDADSHGGATILASEIEKLFDRFEAAWQTTSHPDIEPYLRELPTARNIILRELVRIDLECRLKFGEIARVEEYLGRFAELADDEEFCLQLISQEFILRRRTDPNLSGEEFLRRFPQWAAKLIDVLMRGSDSRTSRQRRFSARLNCPHCHNPIEIVADSVDDDVLCPSCGSAVHLDTGRTLTWDKKHLPVIAHFELIEAVGRGAFGTVYKARDQQLQRIVAIKIPRSGVLETDEDEDRFVREARNVAQLRHPGIVAIHSVGRSDTFPYLVSEFVEGVTLTQYLTAKRVSIKESARLARDICVALHHAHSQGVIHRDLKPSNIMLTPDGSPQIMDFGFAKRNAGEITMTLDGQVLGTPAYMSPEQARGMSHQADARSDVYSVGVILFQLLTGELPFRGEVRMLLHQVIHDEPPSPRKLNNQVPRDLETICLKCMAKEPNRRFESAQGLANDLQRYLDGTPILARPVSHVEHAWRWCRRNSVVASLSMTAFLLLILTAVISFAAYLREAYLAGENGRLAADANRSKNDAIAAKGKAEGLADQEREAKENERTAREDAERNAKAANKQENLALLHVYAAHMNLAQLNWESNRVGETVRLLEVHRPPEKDRGSPKDLRGFEWFYWNRMCHSDLLTLKGERITGSALSADGKTVALVDSFKTIKLCDISNGNTRLAMNCKNTVRCVCFSPDGSMLASGGEGAIDIWSTTTGKVQRTLDDGERYVWDLAFDPSGEALAIANSDGQVNLWDVSKGRVLQRIQVRDRATYRLAFSPDGKRLVSLGPDDRLDVRDTSTGEQLLNLVVPGGPLYGVAFSPDGKRLVFGGYDKTVHVRESFTGNELLTLRGHASHAHAVAFNPYGHLVAGGSIDGSITIWNSTTGEAMSTLKGHTHEVHSIDFTADGRKIISSGEDGVKIWDALSSQAPMPMRENVKDDQSKCVTFSPDGRRLASANSDGTVKIWDPGTGNLLLNLAGRDDVGGNGHEGVAFSPDGAKLASTNHGKSIAIWDAISGRQLLRLEGHKIAVVGVAFSRIGSRLGSVGDDGRVKIWDFSSGVEAIELQDNVPPQQWEFRKNIVFSPDGKLLVVSSMTGPVRIWDTATGRRISTQHPLANLSGIVAFSPDGNRIAVTSADGIPSREHPIRIADAVTGETQLTLGHTSKVYSIVFSSDGRRLVASSHDSTVKVWDTDAGQELLTLRGDGMDILSVAISSDGQRIASGTWTGVRVWDAGGSDVGDRRVFSLLRYQELLAEIIEKAPEQTRAQESLVGSYDAVGRWFSETGQPEKAFGQFRLLQDASQKMVLSNPDMVANHRRWQMSHQRLGKTLLQLGRARESVEFFQKSLELAQKNCELFPEDRLCKNNLLYSHLDIGDSHDRQVENVAALAAYQRALNLALELAGSKPEDAAAHRDLKTCYAKFGNFEERRFHFATARKYYDDGWKALNEFSGRTNLTTFQSELKRFRQLIESCETAERSTQDLEFVIGLGVADAPKWLSLRVDALLAYSDSSPEDVPVEIRQKLSGNNLKAELIREAVSTCDTLRGLEPGSAESLYGAGRCFSLCLKKLITTGMNDDEVVRKANLQSKALESLKAAISAGWSNADDTEDAGFDPLRELPEFKAMLESLRAKQKTP